MQTQNTHTAPVSTPAIDEATAAVAAARRRLAELQGEMDAMPDRIRGAALGHDFQQLATLKRRHAELPAERFEAEENELLAAIALVEARRERLKPLEIKHKMELDAAMSALDAAHAMVSRLDSLYRGFWTQSLGLGQERDLLQKRLENLRALRTQELIGDTTPVMTRIW